MSEKNIVLDHVTQTFRGAAMRTLGGEFRAVDEVSFHLNGEPPQIMSLVGQSGSGKSTLARIILGLQQPTSGRVTYGGKDIYTLSGREYDTYRREVQPVFQDPYSIFNPFYRIDRVFWTAISKFKLASSKQQGLAKIEESLQHFFASKLRRDDATSRLDTRTIRPLRGLILQARNEGQLSGRYGLVDIASEDVARLRDCIGCDVLSLAN